MASREGDRVVALSVQLAQAHQELRRQIGEIRAGLGGRGSGGALVTQCLAFCEALTSHHQGEDGGMFSALLRGRPDLAGTVAKLVEDHQMMSAIVSRVRELAGGTADSDESAAGSIERELDGLAAIMESHFRYEERTVSDALDDGMADGVAEADWSEAVFRFGAG